ncbi:hypothetical protein [Atopobium fossor]|uniref:hypothetical protein n=1 Tax=Atopobium fossor TaxID=39487 RepID=UPI0003F4AE4E|nr:hypothetical protein [Atopobium fossor]
MLTLVAAGFSYEEAIGLSPIDTQIYLSIRNAWSIPADRRITGGVVMASREQVLQALRG